GDTPAPTPGLSTDDFLYCSSEFSSDLYFDLTAEYPDCGGTVCFIGDGYCDEETNNAECGYDGGDCCDCDCIDGFYDCATAGYDCQDIDSTCYAVGG
ncbi:unnamed protein product, partial [Ectocarpus sp. 13 AM-2016]